VVVSGTGPVTYQWRRNGVNIVGASSASLVLTNVAPAAAGNYSCVVSNGCSTATSANAALTLCPGDYNCDGSSDFFDYDDFVGDFEAGAPRSDFNQDGSIDFFDYGDFVFAYESGC